MAAAKQIVQKESRTNEIDAAYLSPAEGGNVSTSSCALESGDDIDGESVASSGIPFGDEVVGFVVVGDKVGTIVGAAVGMPVMTLLG